ncbi:unnamed protein product, partial [Iphiclides podalirius]
MRSRGHRLPRQRFYLPPLCPRSNPGPLGNSFHRDPRPVARKVFPVRSRLGTSPLFCVSVRSRDCLPKPAARTQL